MSINQINQSTDNNHSFCADTLAVRAGIETDQQHGAITPALYLSSNYSFAGFNEPRQFDYSRSGNPTRQLLGDALAELESGTVGVVTSTGMSAITTVLHLVKAGQRIIVPHDCYGGSFRLFRSYAEKGLFDVDFIDQGDEQALAQSLQTPTALVWIETPSNPLLRIVDIEKIAALAKEANPDCIVVADNTFLSPVLQKPLDLGADVVVHSTTKYINGHSDVVGGAVVAKDAEIGEQLGWWANCIGVTGSPFDSLLTLRGLRTLDVRLQRHLANAEKLVNFLVSHPQVDKVYYPGLADHPGHDIASRQQQGFGAMFSFELKGDVETVKQFLSGLHLFSLAESLGGVESLICHPSTMTHAAVALADQETAGIKQNLLRVSTGIENIDDLLADLERGLAAIEGVTAQQESSHSDKTNQRQPFAAAV